MNEQLARAEFRALIESEAVRRMGPNDWRSVYVSFTAKDGSTETVRVVNPAALGDQDEATPVRSAS